MREILFRGKDCNTGEWRYFNLFDTDMHSVEHNTIGQYTGLEDSSNILRIYEGDILASDEYGVTAIVEWKGDGYIARFENGVKVALANVNECYKVIGNIHDKEG